MGSTEKRRKGQAAGTKTSGTERGPRQPGSWLPDSSSVVSAKTFVSPKGRRYRILRTDETDAPKKSKR